MFVIPKNGLIVRDPVSKQPLPAAGKEVPDFDMYWHRRVRDGDVTVRTEATEPAADAARPDAASEAAASA